MRVFICVLINFKMLVINGKVRVIWNVFILSFEVWFYRCFFIRNIRNEVVFLLFFNFFKGRCIFLLEDLSIFFIVF